MKLLFVCALAFVASLGRSSRPEDEIPKGTLLIGVLTVQSSYKDNTETQAIKVPDTVQFWVLDSTAWRIRTFAIDHDIHTHTLGLPKTEPIAYFRSHIERKYGEVLARLVQITVADDSAHDRAVLEAAGLSGALERAPTGLVFWNPDGGRYRTQSTPE